ncbi:hypothetical protein ECOLI_p130004 [Escherichia coli]|nr:hypothetical protein ECOLI_p130004 [Escherichia coli]
MRLYFGPWACCVRFVFLANTRSAFTLEAKLALELFSKLFKGFNLLT